MIPEEIRIWRMVIVLSCALCVGILMTMSDIGGVWVVTASFVAGLLAMFIASGMVTTVEVLAALDEVEYRTSEELANVIASHRGIGEIDEFNRPNPGCVEFILERLGRTDDAIQRHERYFASAQKSSTTYSFRLKRPEPRPPQMRITPPSHARPLA